jgi:hypothetical protein
MIAIKRLDREMCLRALTEFWRAETRVEETREGFAIALPLLYPDGWQIVVALEQLTSRDARLSDKGRTLGKLAELGLNWDRTAKSNQALLDERLKAFELQRDGFEISTMACLPLRGLDVHLFGEALVSIAHLAYRVEAAQPPQSAADAAVRRTLEARKTLFRERALVDGRLERNIRIDYLVQNSGVMAIEVVKRQGNMLPYMEQWGWRWTDIHEANPDMLRAMIFDPDKQDWDNTALSIGRNVCDVFCSYYETNRIEEALDRVA